MKKNYFLLLTFLLIIQNCYSQKSDNECIQGKWEIIYGNQKEGDYSYDIYKNQKILSILSENKRFTYHISHFGFITSDSLVENFKLKLDSIKNTGYYYCTYDIDKENNIGINVNVLDHFYVSDNCKEISYGNSKNYDGYRIEYIPFDKLVRLPNDILFDFFNFKIVFVNKSIINKQPKQATKMYLLKNDPVEVIEEKDNWLKIKYYPEKNGEWTGKTIEGWIKKSDVE